MSALPRMARGDVYMFRMQPMVGATRRRQPLQECAEMKRPPVLRLGPTFTEVAGALDGMLRHGCERYIANAKCQIVFHRS
jgi:hypothetical protein